jgi:hypothetical protein
LQILLRQTSTYHPTGRNILDYFQGEYNYKFQGIEYSTIKYFDFTDHINNVDQIINVNPHLNEKDDERDDENCLGIYISCKCKFLTPENKIIFLFVLFDEIAFCSSNNDPCEYDAAAVHIFPCEDWDTLSLLQSGVSDTLRSPEHDGLPKINMKTHFWSNLIMRNGQYPVEIVRSKDDEMFEDVTQFSVETMLFISNM